jgi:hypothetical protein
MMKRSNALAIQVVAFITSLRYPLKSHLRVQSRAFWIRSVSATERYEGRYSSILQTRRAKSLGHAANNVPLASNWRMDLEHERAQARSYFATSQ